MKGKEQLGDSNSPKSHFEIKSLMAINNRQAIQKGYQPLFGKDAQQAAVQRQLQEILGNRRHILRQRRDK